MLFQKFDRSKILQDSLQNRYNKVHIADIYVKPDDPYPELPSNIRESVSHIADYIVESRATNKSVMLAFGAHSIKNGLGPLMIEYIKRGWVTHLATNGAGIIHDWEFAFQGQSSESVRDNLPKGKFGTWEETGFSLNMAIIAGAYEGLGYGASVGKAIEEQGLRIPDDSELLNVIRESDDLDKVSAAADFLNAIHKAGLVPGWKEIPTPFRRFSLQAGAWRLNVASTDHPMFGHDIIYTHYLNCGDAIGRTAGRDFSTFVNSFHGLDRGGVYLSLGSAIMSPMVFQKAFSLSPIHEYHMAVVDLEKPKWSRIFEDSNPASMDVLLTDNRLFLLALYHELKIKTGNGTL